MPEQGDISVQKMHCRDQPLERVVVFNDRAELKRKVQCALQPGVNEVQLENVTHHIIHDSVRVDGRGDGVIHDVQLSDKAAVHEDTDSPKVAEIRARFEAKQQQVNELKDRVSVLQRRIEVLDKVVEGAANNVVCPPKDSREPFVLSQETLESLTNFYNFYDQSSTSIRSQLRDVNKSLEKSERELNALQQELNRAESDVFQQRFSKSIIITLESEKGGPIELEVSYQVHGASWRPSYDLRVDTAGQRSLKITYFGSITQSTNEDWNNASLVLSTAQPCLGGQIPELGVLEAVFYRPPPAAAPRPCFGVSDRMAARSMAYDDELEEASPCGAAPMMMMKAATASVATPVENALSTEFVIAKPAAIPSDGAEHKVTIGIVDLSPQFVHECVPSKNTSTFLTASAVNSSSLPFLPGDTAVYLNSSFVAKTQMKNVSPGERFSCSLGVDTAVRVEYKPVKKYHEQLGIINKTSSTVYEQIIIVKNSRAEPILLTVKEHIPRSTDEKIKVRLINPVASQSEEAANNGEGDLTSAAELPKEGARMKGGILEWTITAHDGKSAELHVKYAVEHPKDETIEFVERH